MRIALLRCEMGLDQHLEQLFILVLPQYKFDSSCNPTSKEGHAPV
jgi:hypothetical protein